MRPPWPNSRGPRRPWPYLGLLLASCHRTPAQLTPSLWTVPAASYLSQTRTNSCPVARAQTAPPSILLRAGGPPSSRRITFPHVPCSQMRDEIRIVTEATLISSINRRRSSLLPISFASTAHLNPGGKFSAFALLSWLLVYVSRPPPSRYSGLASSQCVTVMIYCRFYPFGGYTSPSYCSNSSR